MQTEQKLLINIPFMGFYNSWYNQEIDSIQEQESNYLEENQMDNPDGRLTESDFQDLFWRHTDYSIAHKEIAQKYVSFFNEYVKDECNIELGLEFESMTSPREYNFQTDRIFAYIAIEPAQELLDNVYKLKLSEVIKERFTSRDGFISHYSNDIEDWLEKSIGEWDHNELCTLLIASLDLPEDWEFEVYQEMVDKGVFYTALQNAVDWSAFEQAIEELRQEKREENN